MMALILGITGMTRDTEAAVHAAFKVANAEVGGRWSLAPAEDADYVVIDLDSLYGPMSLLKLHNAGKKIIGLTSVERRQTEFRLQPPVNANDLAVLLSEIMTDAVNPVPAATPSPAPPPSSTPEIAVASEPILTPILASTPEQPPAPPPAPILEPPPTSAPEPEPAHHLLLHWLETGALQERVQLQRDGLPTLLLDRTSALWEGAPALKLLTPWFSEPLCEDDFHPLSDADWQTASAALGTMQPIARLLWLGGLLSKAPLSGRYVMTKWPQTEREYPKHFRIATVMMKGAATLEEITQASAVEQNEVIDFINANLATHHAEAVADAPASDKAQPHKPSGLLSRLRGH